MNRPGAVGRADYIAAVLPIPGDGWPRPLWKPVLILMCLYWSTIYTF